MKNLKGHQGDVQFKEIAKLPKEANKVENRPIAFGEISGHCHALTGNVEMFEVDGKLIAVVGRDGARLQHVHESKLNPKVWKSTEELQIADHKSHLLPEGIYEFYIQNAYNPYLKLMEKVTD